MFIIIAIHMPSHRCPPLLHWPANKVSTPASSMSLLYIAYYMSGDGNWMNDTVHTSAESLHIYLTPCTCRCSRVQCVLPSVLVAQRPKRCHEQALEWVHVPYHGLRELKHSMLQVLVLQLQLSAFCLVLSCRLFEKE